VNPGARRISMRKKHISLTLIIALSFLSAKVKADFEFGVNGDENGIRDFHLAIGNYYRVPDTQITIVHQKHVSDEELPVVFFLAQKAKVSPDLVVDLRLGGKSWLDISYYYGMGADIFYVPVKSADVPPYGKALGYYKNKPKKEWKYIKLSDDDVVNLVNLKFISSHYGYSPDEVIKMRSNGKSFMAISKDFKDHKDKPGQNIEKQDNKSYKSNKSKPHGKKK
jgi:hypothetical protein